MARGNAEKKSASQMTQHPVKKDGESRQYVTKLEVTWQRNQNVSCRLFPLFDFELSMFLIVLFSFFITVILLFVIYPYLTSKSQKLLLIEYDAFSVPEPTGIEHLEKQVFLVDVNTATVGELCILPGIGETMARRIVAEREQNGRFNSLEDLVRVYGIGKKKLKTLEPMLRPIINTEAIAEQPPPTNPTI